MRISDWSSDVCSSDLPIVTTGPHDAIAEVDRAALELVLGHLIQNAIEASPPTEPVTLAVSTDGERVAIDVIDRGCGMTPARSEERRVGKECGSKCSSRWSPYH